MSNYPTVECPDGWRPIEYLMEPTNGSKAFRHNETGANAHVIALNRGRSTGYTAQFESSTNEFTEERLISFDEAVQVVQDWLDEFEAEQECEKQ